AEMHRNEIVYTRQHHLNAVVYLLNERRGALVRANEQLKTLREAGSSFDASYLRRIGRQLKRYDGRLQRAFQQASAAIDPATAATIDPSWSDLEEEVNGAIIELNAVTSYFESRELD